MCDRPRAIAGAPRDVTTAPLQVAAIKRNIDARTAALATLPPMFVRWLDRARRGAAHPAALVVSGDEWLDARLAPSTASMPPAQCDPHTVPLTQFAARDIARALARRHARAYRALHWCALLKLDAALVARRFGAVDDADPLALAAAVVKPAAAAPSLPPAVDRFAALFHQVRQKCRAAASSR